MAFLGFLIIGCVAVLCLYYFSFSISINRVSRTRGSSSGASQSKSTEGNLKFEEKGPAPEQMHVPAIQIAMEKDQTVSSASTTATATELMPPPPRPRTSLKPRTGPTLPGSHRVPSNGPLPNRLPSGKTPPTSSSTLGSSLSASTSTQAPANRPRKKVILAPGHSPLDWADTTRSKDLSGVPYPQRITPSQLKVQTGRKGKPAWASYKGKVYNIGPYLDFHPGGVPELMKAAGRDGAQLFEEIHPWVNWDNMLGSCLVGFLVPEPEGEEEGLEGLD